MFDNKFDDFCSGYVEALLVVDFGSDEWVSPTVNSISQEARDRIVADCTRFLDGPAKELLEQAYEINKGYGPWQAGIDFYLTRNGHGAGFWDRGLGDVGRGLTELVGRGTEFPEVNSYIGDDGLVYIQ